MVGLRIVGGDHDAVHGARTGPPNPGKRDGGSGLSSVRAVTGAVRPRSSTGTKSIAYDEANSAVPWLGTRFAGLFCTSHRPRNG